MQQMQQQVWRLYMLNGELCIARIKKRTSASSVAEKKKAEKNLTKELFFSEKKSKENVYENPCNANKEP